MVSIASVWPSLSEKLTQNASPSTAIDHHPATGGKGVLMQFQGIGTVLQIIGRRVDNGGQLASLSCGGSALIQARAKPEVYRWH